MPSAIWTRSTEKQVNSSAGALLRYYTSISERLNCGNTSHYVWGPDVTSIGWTVKTGGIRGSHLFTFPAQETQDSPQIVPPELLARLYCHAIVSALPYEALSDLVEDLRDLETRFLTPTQPTQPANALPRLRAKVGNPVSRPEIQLAGE